MYMKHTHTKKIWLHFQTFMMKWGEEGGGGLKIFKCIEITLRQ